MTELIDLMIETYVDDIKKALSNELYFPALSLALTLPDICGSVEFPNKQIYERYIVWYDKYIGYFSKEISEKAPGDEPYLSGEIVYNLRNTFLHNGLPGVDVLPHSMPEEREDEGGCLQGWLSERVFR